MAGPFFLAARRTARLLTPSDAHPADAHCGALLLFFALPVRVVIFARLGGDGSRRIQTSALCIVSPDKNTRWDIGYSFRKTLPLSGAVHTLWRVSRLFDSLTRFNRRYPTFTLDHGF